MRMNRVIAILTVLSVLAHAVVGCCAHSVHSAASHSHGHGDHAATHSHHHDGENATPPCDHEPGKDHSCHHAKCLWLASSNMVDISVASPFDTMGLIGDIATLQASELFSLRHAAVSESPPRLPLRSHLALGVLLI